MENEKKDGQSVELSVIKPENFSIIEGLEKKQLAIVEQFPFVAIKDKETYEQAKRNRTGLLTASTTVEKDEKKFGVTANQLIKDARQLILNCANITRDKYKIQQEEIERHEKILQEEIDRKAKIAKDREDGIKGNIQNLIGEYNAKIESMGYADIETVSGIIKKSISENRGTFQEFDILFNRDVESVLYRLDDKTKSVTEAFENAEIDRKKKHTDKMSEIELGIKSIVLELTAENFDEKEKEFQVIANGQHDFEEFAEQYIELHSQLTDLFLKKAGEVEEQASQKRQADLDRQELEEHRLNKRFSDRCDELKRIGMSQDENGDFSAYDLTYTKNDIKADENEIFDQTAENIGNFIKTESAKPKEEIVPVVEENQIAETVDLQSDETTASAAEFEVKDEIVENALESGHAAEKLSGAIDIIENAPTWEKLGYVTNVGELKKILSGFADDTALGFINQPQQALHVMLDTKEDKTLLGFQIVVDDLIAAIDVK